MAIIYDSEHTELHFIEGNKEFLLITFNNFAVLADGKRFWGEKFVKDNNLTCLSFMSKDQSWFPRSQMMDLIKFVIPIIEKHSTVVLYGNSMGGYAVLKYGALLRATHTLSVNPQVTIEPSLLNSDERFVTYYRDDIHAGMRVNYEDTGRINYVVYDPHCVEDYEHIRFIESFDNIRLLPMTYTNHYGIRVVAESNKIYEVIRNIIDSDFNYSLIKQRLRFWKKSLVLYKLHLGLALEKSGKIKAELIVDSIFKMPNFNEFDAIECCKVLNKNKTTKLTQKFIQQSLLKFPHSEILYTFLR